MFLGSVAGTLAVIFLAIRHKAPNFTGCPGRLSVCPGQTFAEAFLWVTMATLLFNINMLGSLDRAGKEVIPEERFEGTVTRSRSHYLFTTD